MARAGDKHRGNYPESCELGLSLLAEFRAAGVEPSLGAFYQLMEIFYSKETNFCVFWAVGIESYF